MLGQTSIAEVAVVERRLKKRRRAVKNACGEEALRETAQVPTPPDEQAPGEKAPDALAAPTTVINMDNYVAAETELHFASVASLTAINTFLHKDVVNLDNQEFIRSNRDVLYSLALVDVREGVRFIIPDSGRYQIIHIIDENHLFHKSVNEGESLHITKDDLSSGEYVYLLARTKIIGDDIEGAQKAQKRMIINAKSAVPYTKDNFDKEATDAFRAKLFADVFETGEARMPVGLQAFRETYDAEFHHDYVYGAALGWGGLSPTDANYAPSTPGEGVMECSSLTFKEPKLKFDERGYYSITIYGADGFIESDKFYLPSEKMQDNGDGTKTVYVNCPDVKNSLTAPEKGWQATLRLFRPADVHDIVEYVNEYWYKEVKFEPVK
jgi:hypothetical protein